MVTFSMTFTVIGHVIFAVEYLKVTIGQLETIHNLSTGTTFNDRE